MKPIHSPHDLHVGRPGVIVKRDDVHNAQYISVHHAYNVGVVLAQGHVAEVLDKIHDTCAIVIEF